MKQVLIVGLESSVGSNAALALAKHHHVAGLSAVKTPGVAGVESRPGFPQTAQAVRQELAVVSPDLVVVCGPAADSVWSSAGARSLEESSLKTAALWAQELAGTDCRLIVVSSDAVFHGPWMFHEEACSGVCHSASATAIREMETQVLKLCRQALVLRTHAFGWSPKPSGGWLENLVDEIAAGRPLKIPSQNYATPIAAARLAELVIGAWDRKLEGIYHVAGSERVNFRHFAHRLAQEFQLPRPKFRTQHAEASPEEFGQGETSLDSSRFRRAVGTALPMLAESLMQLREQAESGQREQLVCEESPITAHAA